MRELNPTAIAILIILVLYSAAPYIPQSLPLEPPLSKAVIADYYEYVASVCALQLICNVPPRSSMRNLRLASEVTNEIATISPSLHYFTKMPAVIEAIGNQLADKEGKLTNGERGLLTTLHDFCLQAVDYLSGSILEPQETKMMEANSHKVFNSLNAALTSFSSPTPAWESLTSEVIGSKTAGRIAKDAIESLLGAPASTCDLQVGSSVAQEKLWLVTFDHGYDKYTVTMTQRGGIITDIVRWRKGAHREENMKAVDIDARIATILDTFSLSKFEAVAEPVFDGTGYTQRFYALIGGIYDLNRYAELRLDSDGELLSIRMGTLSIYSAPDDLSPSDYFDSDVARSTITQYMRVTYLYSFYSDQLYHLYRVDEENLHLTVQVAAADLSVTILKGR